MIRRVSLSVGVVTYRSRIDILDRLVGSLLGAFHLLGADRSVEAAVYVVCNDEDPDRLQAISKLVENHANKASKMVRFEVIQGHGNIGYGAAQNLAIECSSSDFHLMLNPDVVLETEALVECVRYLETNEDTVMTVPQGFDPAGDYARLSKRRPTILVLLLRGLSVGASDGILGRRVGHYIYSDRLPSGSDQQVDLASGCFMFCRSSVLEKIGGFDERYFLYFEDYDLSNRISEHGFIREIPSVKICHYGGFTVKRGYRRISHFLRSAFIYFQQYGWQIF